MNKRFLVAFLFLPLGYCTGKDPGAGRTPAPAQPTAAAPALPAVEAILERAMDAQGGHAVLAGIEDFTGIGKIQKPGHSNKTFEYRLLVKGREKLRDSLYQELADGTKGELTYSWDGKRGWTIAPNGAIIDDPLGFNRVREFLLYDVYTLHQRFVDGELQLSVAGETKTDGVEVVELEGKASVPKEVRFFFRKDNGLLYKVSFLKMKYVKLGDEFEEIVLGDYRSTGDALLPHKVAIWRVNRYVREVTTSVAYDEIRVNSGIPDDEFMRPDGQGILRQRMREKRRSPNPRVQPGSGK